MKGVQSDAILEQNWTWRTFKVRQCWNRPEREGRSKWVNVDTGLKEKRVSNRSVGSDRDLHNQWLTRLFLYLPDISWGAFIPKKKESFNPRHKTHWSKGSGSDDVWPSGLRVGSWPDPVGFGSGWSDPKPTGQKHGGSDSDILTHGFWVRDGLTQNPLVKNIVGQIQTFWPMGFGSEKVWPKTHGSDSDAPMASQLISDGKRVNLWFCHDKQAAS